MTASDWTQLREFDGVDLSESYVLGWVLAEDELVLELDVALTPDHALYTPPRAEERTCWVRGHLHCPGASSVQGLQDQCGIVGATDATGAGDYGSIDELSWADGQAHIVGEFGDITLRSSRPHITFSAHGTLSV
jgi:hypothetical protein